MLNLYFLEVLALRRQEEIEREARRYHGLHPDWRDEPDDRMSERDQMIEVDGASCRHEFRAAKLQLDA